MIACQTQTARILVLDDNRDMADGLARLLTMLGYDALAVYEGSQAIAQARQWQPDLVLTDLNLPDMTGYEVATQIRAQSTGGLKIVAITGWMRDRNELALRRAGFDGFLTKPVPVTELGQFLPVAARLPQADPDSHGRRSLPR